MDNTVIGFTSDHGEMNGDWGLIYKMNFLDGALRVPLIVRTPETAANGGGKVVDAPAENCDLGPTLLELAGGSIDYPQFAKSLVPAMEPSTEGLAPRTHREAAISEYRGEFMVTDGKWKAAVNKDGQVYLLFDLVNDPRETRNLAGLSEYRAPVRHDASAAFRARLRDPVPERGGVAAAGVAQPLSTPIEQTSLPFARVPGMELLAELYRPRNAADRLGRAVVMVHGGAWSIGDRLSMQTLCEEFARRGMSVFSLDFRDGRNGKHPCAVADIAAGIRHVRANAERLEVDPDHIGLVGSSSGGHLVLLTGSSRTWMRTGAPRSGWTARFRRRRCQPGRAT